MRFALEKINNDSSILYGNKLHADMKDATNINDLVLGLISNFALGRTHCAIGPMLSKDAYELAFLGKSIHYPLVSYHADYDSGEHVKNSYFFRTVHTDNFRVLVLLDVVKALKWNYISVISSYHLNGERLARVFISKLSTISVSIGVQRQLLDKPDENEYEEAVRRLNRSKRAKGLVLFTTIDDSIGILRALKKANLSKNFQLLSAYGFSNYIDITTGYEDIAEGAVTIDHRSSEIPEFRDYFLRLNPNSRKGNKWFDEFWETTFDCKLSSSSTSNKAVCTGKEKLSLGKGYYSNTPVRTVISAVYSMAMAYKHVLDTWCKSKKAGDYCKIGPAYLYISKLPRYFRKHAFSDLSLNITSPLVNDNAYLISYDILNYVKKGNSYENNKIGSWSLKIENLTTQGNNIFEEDVKGVLVLNTSVVKWKGEKSAIATSVCSLPCKPGEKKVWSVNCQKSSCWDCKKCPKNHITRNNNCLDCGIFKKPNKWYKSCDPVKIKYLDITTQVASVIILLVCITGLILTAVVIVTFIKNRDNFIVKASGKELCYFILAGICLCFISPVFYMIKPTDVTCFLRCIFPGLGYCVCYASLFLKTNRIYRIFHHAKQSVSVLSLISPQSQILLVIGIMSMQLLIGVVWAASERTTSVSVVKQYIPDNKEYIVLHCGEDSSPLALNLILSVVFMIGCTWFAFKTRNFPKNYNEAKHIGRTMYVTCILWAIFFPAFAIIKEDASFTRAYLMMSLIVLTAYTSLVGLFAPKMKLLFSPAPLDRKLDSSQNNVRKVRLTPEGSYDESYPSQFSAGTFRTESTSAVPIPNHYAK